jgi:hypothetical protein
VLCGQRNEFLRQLSQLSRPELILFLSSSSSIILTSGPHSTTTANQKIRRIFLRLVFLRSVRRLLVTASIVPSSPILVTLRKEALSSFETSVLTRATRRHHSSSLEYLRRVLVFIQTALTDGWYGLNVRGSILQNRRQKSFGAHEQTQMDFFGDRSVVWFF